MQLFRLALVSFIFSMPGVAQSQAYKCAVNGAVVFQQQPCEGGTKLNVAPPPDPSTRAGRLELAIAGKRVFIGMTEEEVLRSWGKPNKINKSISARSVHEQWIYENGKVGGSQYLYLENGVLRSMQSPE